VGDGVGGYLAPVGDVRGMAEKAVKILQNTGLREELAAAARDRAVDLFTVDKIIPEYEKIYQKIV
ncbi:MAG TPA: N-acetyl-alpha-D-glucosaminyl L-malate synthase BshA, partial [Desulfobacteria bacterium]|nr:N-acetyl-alpha-D-glucosaminyl L-malate synthase BshA [Desulfobacteria bacterium]